VKRVLQAIQDQRAHSAHLGRKEYVEALVSRVQPAQLDSLDSRDLLGTRAVPDREAISVRKEILVSRVSRVAPV